MLSKFPITVSAPLLIGLPVLAIGLWLSLMWNHQSKKAITELADQNIEQIHDLATTKVADVLSIPVRLCKVNAHLVNSGALDPADLDSWRSTFVEQAQAFDMLSTVGWGSADGRSAWVSRYADGSCYWALKDDASEPTMVEWRLDEQGDIPSEPSNTFDFDLFTRPWFLAPREAGEATWSEPYVWVGGVGSEGTTLGISYGIPLYDPQGEFLGAIDADFSLNDLSRFLNSISFGKTGVAVLTTHDRHLLAASAETPIITSAGERVNALDSSDPLIVAAANYIGDAESVLNTHAQIQVDGEVYYLRASPVGHKLGLNWTLTTIIPEKDFIADIEAEFRLSSLISLAAVGATVVAGLVAARWLVNPLVTLVTAVRRIGQGDLETQVRIHHAPEYTQLAEEINQMTLGLQDRMRMRESLSLAMEVQRNLLPSKNPKIAGLDIAGHSTYCDETGGDYYDFLDVSDVDEETAVIAVGDVMGHGVAAAMLMATARGILRSRSAVSGSLADFLDHMNAMLVPDTRGERFMTMLLVTICAGENHLRWASAGHGPPIIYHAISDSFLELDGGGLPLGLIEEELYDEYSQPDITSGDLILAATDGLWETCDQNDELYGMDRLRRLLRENSDRSAAEISEEIRESLARHRGPVAQDDDLTFVVAKVL